MGLYALRGNWDNERKQLKKEPHRFLNTMTMKSGYIYHRGWLDLPSLSVFKGEIWNYGCVDTVTLESRGLGCMQWRCPSLIIGCDWMPSNTIGCHQIRQQLFLLHIPCSHQRLIAHPSIPLLSFKVRASACSFHLCSIITPTNTPIYTVSHFLPLLTYQEREQ